MKKGLTKRLITVIMTLAMILSLLPTMSLTVAAASLPSTMWVDLGNEVQITLFKSGNNYQLYLPGNVDAADCRFSWDGDLQATYSSTKYDSGSCPVPLPDAGLKSYSFSYGGQSTTFNVTTYQGSSSVMPIYIDIDETQGTIAAMDGDTNHETFCVGRINIEGQWKNMPKIKGRGNYTWSQSRDKKAYNITLENKITISGIDAKKTKKWTILSEIGDHSLLCNRSGFHLAHELGVGQDTASADVWMNGEYQGCYTITPKTDSYVSDTGYLIEEDNYLETTAVEDGGDPQFELEGMTGGGGDSSHYNLITVKKIGKDLLGEGGETPENINAAAEEIRLWLQDAWDAIRDKDGYNSKGKYYTDYIDIESFAKMYLMQEYVKSYDVCAGSIFFHRDGNTEEDKLIAGPIWDLDNAMGSTQENPYLGTVRDRRSGKGTFIEDMTEYKTSIYKTLYKHEDFQKEVKRQYNKYKSAFDSLETDVANMIGTEEVEGIKASAMMNHIKVENIGYNLHKYYRAITLESGNPKYKQEMKATTDNKTDWPNYAANLKTYIHARSLWFDEVYYDATYQCEHEYEDVVTPATCTAGGYTTHTCKYCGESYVDDETPKIAHDYQDGECIVCHEKLINVTIDCDKGAKVTVYPTKNLNGDCVENATLVHPRDGDSGLIDCSGNAQVNFVVNVKPGYELVTDEEGKVIITAEPTSSYKNLKYLENTGNAYSFRATQVKDDFTIIVRTIQTGPTISQHNLLLSSEIGVQFKVLLPEDFDATGSYMSFAVSSGKTRTMQIEDAKKVDGENAYWFTCYVNALELADTVEATYHFGEEGTLIDTYSAVTYIEGAKRVFPDKEKLINLVNALQDYGHYLQNSGWTDDRSHAAIEGITELDQDSIDFALDSVSEMAIEKDLGTSGIADVKFALTLNSKTVINVFVKPGEESFTVANATANGTRVIDGDTYYQYDTVSIGAGHLGKIYKVTLTTETGRATIKASAMSYVNAVLNNTSFTDEKRLAMAAYYNYYAAVSAYTQQ